MSNNKTTLDRDSISAIAEQIETRIRQESGTTSSNDRKHHDRGTKGVFFWGAASGLAVAFVAPLLSKQARPVVRGAIKQGILASRYVQRVASTLKEDVQDITAEAKVDLEVEKDSSAPQANS